MRCRTRLDAAKLSKDFAFLSINNYLKFALDKVYFHSNIEVRSVVRSTLCFGAFSKFVEYRYRVVFLQTCLTFVFGVTMSINSSSRQIRAK